MTTNCEVEQSPISTNQQQDALGGGGIYIVLGLVVGALIMGLMGKIMGGDNLISRNSRLSESPSD